MWLKERFKEKSTYAGFATLAIPVIGEFIPIPFAGELLQYALGGLLILMREKK